MAKRSVIIVNAVSGKEAIHLTGSACDLRAVKLPRRDTLSLSHYTAALLLSCLHVNRQQGQL